LAEKTHLEIMVISWLATYL